MLLITALYFTMTLNPVTAAKEVAREALARGSSPRRPTNMREMVWMIFCRRLPTASGVASRSCVFTSLITTSAPPLRFSIAVPDFQQRVNCDGQPNKTSLIYRNCYFGRRPLTTTTPNCQPAG
jgi:hypothetical protein